MSKVIFGGSSPLTELSDSESPQAENPTGSQASVQQHLAYLYALSPEHNSRNIEHPWYGFWNRALHDSVKDTDNLVVFPQFLVWASPQGYLDLDAGDDYVPKKRDQSVLTSLEIQTRAAAKKIKLAGLFAADTSSHDLSVGTHSAPSTFQSSDSELESIRSSQVGSVSATSKVTGAASVTSVASAATDPLPKNSTTRIADFAILELLDKQLKNQIPSRVNAVDFKVKILVEIKRLPSRRHGKSLFEMVLLAKVDEAKTDTYWQACVLFESYPGIRSVMAIAASGDYWCSAILRRHHIPENVRTAIGVSHKEKHKLAEWTLPIPLKDSWDRLQKLFNA